MGLYSLRNLWNQEPVRIVGVLQALLALAVTFGLKLTPEQIGALLAASSLILAALARSKVTPV